ncbi:MAG TPA: hypothetical protein VMW15_13065 [Terracidiphilus sp.]|jgi:hypothetical protein|nr:hypothetical protein [Terracidiphilus sp.]
MRIVQVQKFTILMCVLAMPAVVFADFSYQQSTQITGGSILGMVKMAGAFSKQARKAGEPVVTAVYLKGNRMAHVSPDSIEIIDLDNETITHIDTEKRTYSVVTFQQMKDAMEKAHQQMEKQQAEHPAPKAAPNPNADNVKVSFDVHVRNTGAVRQVSGLATSEAIMTMMMNATDQNTNQTGTMAITNDMWLVPEIPGYAEVRDFYLRMALKMGTAPAEVGMDINRMLAQNPGASEALADMGKEMQKIKGVPVMQVMRMGTSTDGKPLPAASEAPLPPDSSQAMPSGGEIARQSATSALTSHLGLGGFGGFGHKKQNDQPPADQNSKTPPPASVVLMESQTISSNFSSAPIDPSHFEVPPGYKLIQTQMDKQ